MQFVDHKMFSEEIETHLLALSIVTNRAEIKFGQTYLKSLYDYNKYQFTINFENIISKFLKNF
jgi:hypothetical protein